MRRPPRRSIVKVIARLKVTSMQSSSFPVQSITKSGRPLKCKPKAKYFVLGGGHRNTRSVHRARMPAVSVVRRPHTNQDERIHQNTDRYCGPGQSPSEGGNLR